MTTFAEMLKKQNAVNDIEDLIKSADEGKFAPDERFWKPRVDKAGNGFYVIRFLPAPDTGVPWTKFYTHGFQNEVSGQWYFENCPTTIGKDCPACKANSVLWNTPDPANKEIARSRKRKQHYVSNILVVKDAVNPENEGRIFLFDYGQKIFSKIMGAMKPTFEDEVAINPFDQKAGANFKLKIKQVEGYWNYDSSEFDKKTSPVKGFADDAEIYPLAEFTAEDNHKAYDVLEERLNVVLNNTPVETASSNDDDGGTVETDGSDSGGDADMEYFKKLAQETA